MARPGRQERIRTARSFRQLRRFHHVINSDRVFGTHSRSVAKFAILGGFHHLYAPSLSVRYTQVGPFHQRACGTVVSAKTGACVQIIFAISRAAPRWKSLGPSAPHFSCRTTPPLPQLSSSCAESVVASICLGSTRTGVRQPKPDTVSKKPQSCSWSQTPRSPHARAGHNPFRKLLYVTYPQALRVRKQGILGSVRIFDVPYLNLNIRPQPFFESKKTTNQARPHIFPKS